MKVQAVILAAGMGTRLARPHPKPMTELSDGRTIMHQQVQNLQNAFGKGLRLTIAVGFQARNDPGTRTERVVCVQREL